MKLILVCGKSGVGKSTFAKILAKKLKYKYIDVDKIAHTMYQNKKILNQVVKLFGKVVFNLEGNFDRKKLGEYIFTHSKSVEVKKYNEITKKYIEDKLRKQFDKFNCVVDWLLLPLSSFWDENAYRILIQSDDTLRLQKILLRDNITKEYLNKRENTRIEFDVKQFDIVLNNDYNDINNLVNCALQTLKNSIKLKILGTQSPFCNEENACPSYLINDNETNILLDCGSGSHRFFNMNDLSGLNIFISHLHRDHYNDLFNYMYSALVLNRQNRLIAPINIYIPNYPKTIYEDIKSENNDGTIFFDIDENSKFYIGNFEITFCKVEHSLNVVTYAIKLKTNNKTIVYSADISYASRDKFINFCKNADMLICESSLLTEHNFPKICNHLTAKQAGEIAKLANVKKLILTHLWAEIPKEKYLEEAKIEFKNVFIANEKDEYVI